MKPRPPETSTKLDTEKSRAAREATRTRARTVLLAFIFTFVVARILVYLIMDRRLPDLFLYLHGTHIHHLNHGIFLLAIVGAWLLFRPPTSLRIPALLYGIGLALTFDEFGMWLHLGGGYWQRASWDAVVVVGAVLTWFAFGPSPGIHHSRHWLQTIGVFTAALVFLWLLARSLDHAGQRVLPRFQQVEVDSPP